MGCSNTAEDQANKMENKMDNVQDKLDDAAEADTRAKYESERTDALEKLYDMRGNIDRELLSVNERLATKDMDAEKRAEQEALKAELETQQTEVASVITKVENSQQGTWISVKEDSRRVTENFNNWWDRTKANLDGDRNKDRNKNVR